MFGGVFDDEFSKDSIQLFEQVKRGEVICLYSEIVERELIKAPLHVRSFATSLPWNSAERLKQSGLAKELAQKYVSEKVVFERSFEDCMHIAYATINNADTLVIWNFKHIVNYNRINAFNSINLKFGYNVVEIKSPRKLCHEKENQEKKETF